MLDEAADVAWKKLRGAHAPATNVPKHLSVLAGEDPVARHHAVDALRRELFMARRPSKAGLELARILLQQLAKPASELLDRHRLLVLTVDLALGGHEAFLQRGTDPNDAALKKKLARGTPKDGYKLLAAARETFCELLCHAEPETRSAAALALAFHGIGAADSLAALEAVAEAERDSNVLASFCVSAGLLAGYLEAGVPGICHRANDKDDLLRAAAALGTLYATRELSEAGAAALARGMGVGAVGDARFPFNQGVVDGLIATVLAEHGERGRATLVDGLLVAINNLAGSEENNHRARVHSWGQRCLRTALGRFERSKPNAADPADDDFNEREREVVAGLSKRDSAVDFRPFGLPPKAAERRRLIGVDEPQLLDRRIDVEVGDATKSWPLWRVFATTQRGELTPVALRAQVDGALTLIEQLDAMLAIALRGYGITMAIDLTWYDDVVNRLDAAAWSRAAAAQLLASSEETKPQSRPVLMVLSPLAEAGAIEDEHDSLLPLLMFDREHERIRAILSSVPAARRRTAIDCFMAMCSESMRVATARPFFDLCPSPRYGQMLIDLLVEPGRDSVQPDRFADTLVAMGSETVGTLVDEALKNNATHEKALKRAKKKLKG